MRRECRERFPPPPRFSDPDMHHGTCMTHVPWCMSGSLTTSFLWNRWRGKRSRIPGACAIRDFTYLARGPWHCTVTGSLMLVYSYSNLPGLVTYCLQGLVMQSFFVECKTWLFIMTSSNGNIFRVTGPLCREFTGHRWIPLTKASDTELWCFL